MERIVKIILAVLLFLCLLDMPYEYYQLVRFIAFGVFAYLGFIELGNSNQALGFSYIMLAFLFQPFLKVALGRDLWNIVDVIVGIGLLVSLLKKRTSHRANENNRNH